MLSLFKKAQVVDEQTSRTLQQSFQWVLDNFNQDYFHNNTELVHPTREYFPDRVDNELAMAQALCERIQKYTGLEHWPFTLVPPQQFTGTMPPLLGMDMQQRGCQAQQTATQLSTAEGLSPQLEISYASAMMKKPMDLVASMSKNMAQHMLYQSQRVPPAGPQSFDATAEVLAISMGFGIFIANSAYTFRGSCARCYDPRANRSAALSEDEAIYCLALFCHYKQIDNKQVMPSLKSYLRARLKKARQQLKADLILN
jgi:hypothetical protein